MFIRHKHNIELLLLSEILEQQQQQQQQNEVSKQQLSNVIFNNFLTRFITKNSTEFFFYELQNSTYLFFTKLFYLNNMESHAKLKYHYLENKTKS